MAHVLERDRKRTVGRDSEATLRTLNAFAVDVISIRTAEDLFWYVARNVVGRLNFVDCVIYQADEAGTELRQVAALGEKNPYDRAIINPLRIPFGEGITGRTAAQGAHIVVDDLLADRNYIPDTAPARSEICVPIMSMGRVVGVIDSEHPEPDAFDDAAREVLTTVAAMTGAKLELLVEAERSARRYLDLTRSHAQLAEEIAARKSLEAELFEARKAEAIGRLAGGFAHAFNNILTAISGHLDLVAMEEVGPEARSSIDAAQGAARRGSTVIQDMVSFSQKMQLAPQATDLNALVADMLRQSPWIEMDLAPDAGPAWVDPAAAEVALANLLMNARDATPEGGRVRVGTANVVHAPGERAAPGLELQPGRYIRLDVTDEGTGIAPEVAQRIFDPFFTTKPVGQGVGLGLSMVQGFARQSGGTVAVRPHVPQGTTVELYFPAAG
ncbi:MAG: ATP-binding protein [Pseudomonadota bacterium]